MAKVDIRRSRLVVACTLVFAVGPIVAVGMITARTVGASQSDSIASSELALLVALAIVAFAVTGYLSWVLFSQIRTRFTDEGVWQPRLFSSVFIPWRDVTRVKVTAVQAEIRGADSTIRINLYGFRRPEEVLDLIKRRVPRGTAIG